MTNQTDKTTTPVSGVFSMTRRFKRIFKIFIKLGIYAFCIFSCIVTVLLGLGIFLFHGEYGWDLFRTLPTDEQMIEHFRKHRADFDKLARHYSRFPGADPTPELMALMDRINVTRVGYDMVKWVPTDSSPHDDSRRYSGVVLHYGHPGVRKFDDYLSSVNKLYYYTPFPAPVEDGRLCRPYPSLPLDIFPSLNTYPCELEPHAPVLRKIDSLWYLQMRIQWPEQ
jgi:hypothetical protein